MRTPGILMIGGLFFLHTVAHAQSPASSVFDGTYRLASSAKVSESYVAKGGQSAPCPDRPPGPLTIQRGAARYTAASGREVNGTVGAQGELVMRSVLPGQSRPNELEVNGRIDAAGTARVRERGFSCSYDFVWQK
jgi:hypothetical protein